MPNNDLFSGIPALDDAAGLENVVNQTALNEMGYGNPTVPAALQPQTQVQPQPQTEPTQDPAQPADPAPLAQPATPQYTAEQVAQIVARNQQLEAQARAQQTPQERPQASTYTPQQAAIIKQLIDRGVPIDRIQQALNGNRQQNAIVQRLQQVEQHLQNQQYAAAQNEFITKMTTFGDKFGLSENDLVTFGNTALSKGINLTTIGTAEDIETVFRAIYPEQYAIRSQRIAGANASQIYGGANTPEAPRASVSKLEDAYVDNFLKQSMPNQYNQFPK